MAVRLSEILWLFSQVAKQFYNTVVQVEVVTEEESMEMTHVVMKLNFDNTAFMDAQAKAKGRHSNNRSEINAFINPCLTKFILRKLKRY